MADKPFQDTVEHVSGDDGSADLFHGGDDVADPNPTRLETQGHETLQHHKQRKHMEGHTDKEILKEEGADLPHATHFHNIDIKGAASDD